MAESAFRRKRLALSLRSKRNAVKNFTSTEKCNSSVKENFNHDFKNKIGEDSKVSFMRNTVRTPSKVLSPIENINELKYPKNRDEKPEKIPDMVNEDSLFNDSDDFWTSQITNDMINSLSNCQNNDDDFIIPKKLLNDEDPNSCPPYKYIPGTTFVVDAFSFGIIPGVTAYFLSHFHSDHYGGLESSFNQPIYCTSVTAALVRLKLQVDSRFLHTIDVDQSIDVSGVKVTAMDANHCPGSVMFLFQLKNGRNVLHVGDFRADNKMESYPLLWKLPIDALYLDTTYCEPKYTFPTQKEIIDKVIQVVHSHKKKAPHTLVACGTYSIGKERVFIAVAKALDSKIWTFPDKRIVLNCLQDNDISERLVDEPCDAEVHVYPMGELHFDKLSVHLKHFPRFTHILAIKPSGWELKDGEMADISTQGNVTICGVPYSEHSSYTELERFVKFVKPTHVIPTVNVEDAATLDTYFKQWLSDQESNWSIDISV